MTAALAVVAATWGVMMALSPVLQLRRILDRRSSADISIAYLGPRTWRTDDNRR